MADLIQPQHAASDLAPHAHRCTLRGDPSELTFPPICACCGASATQRLRQTKVFVRSHSDAPQERVMSSVDVPYCDGCSAQHRAGSPPQGALQRAATYFGSADIFGAIVPGVAALWVVANLALPRLWRGDFISVLFSGGLALLFVYVARVQWREAERATAHRRVPRSTEITRAFDYSDDVAAAFEPPRYVCTMRDGAFAQAFLALNASRVWHAASPAARAEAQTARRKTRLVIAALIVVALISFVVEWLG